MTQVRIIKLPIRCFVPLKAWVLWVPDQVREPQWTGMHIWILLEFDEPIWERNATWWKSGWNGWSVPNIHLGSSMHEFWSMSWCLYARQKPSSCRHMIKFASDGRSSVGGKGNTRIRRDHGRSLTRTGFRIFLLQISHGTHPPGYEPYGENPEPLLAVRTRGGKGQEAFSCQWGQTSGGSTPLIARLTYRTPYSDATADLVTFFARSFLYG